MLGLSGGIGPLRASVSTRGFGGSIGPVNFGTGWSGGGPVSLLSVMLGSLALVAGATVVLIAIGWPLLLCVRWIPGWLGIAIGIVLELVYLVGALTVADIRHRARERARDAHCDLKDRERRAAARKDLMTRGRTILDDAPAIRAVMEEKLGQIRARPGGFPAHEMSNLPEDYPRDEHFIGSGDGWLSAGRVAQRGGPRVQADIEPGRWMVTDRAIRFRGSTRTDTWPLTALEGVLHEPGRMLFLLETRKSITGISAGDPDDEMLELRIAVEWARALPHPPVAAIALVESELRAFDDEMAGLRAELDDYAYETSTLPQ